MKMLYEIFGEIESQKRLHNEFDSVVWELGWLPLSVSVRNIHGQIWDQK